jgi:hypothetical protein
MMHDTDNSYYGCQLAAHRWASEVLLGLWAAEKLVYYLCDSFDVRWPQVLWEQPALCAPSLAVTVRNERTGGLTVAFATHGTDLLTLCHEMAHVVNDWDAPHHDVLDWDLTSMMLELTRYLDVE